MPHAIHPIRLAMPLRLGAVNAYLVRSEAGWALIDSGAPNARAALLRALEAAGCRADELRLIALTHGDFDHTGCAAFLRARSGAPIAMHPADAAMLERGDMFAGRAQRNPLMGWLAPRLFGFGRAQRAAPDHLLAEGDDLTPLGLPARVLHLPGHSRGSIGLLTPGGDLFCGDLLANTDGPKLNDLLDDPAAARASVERLRGLGVARVYPGHGEPFDLTAL